MFKNYIKIALRNLFKNKLYSVINIFGLSIGVACCMLILLYLSNEFSYDKFHENSDRIYRAWTHEDYGDGDIYWDVTTPLRLKDEVEATIAEAELVTRRSLYQTQVNVSEQSEGFSESVQLVDDEFFEMFDFNLVQGNSSALFSNPSEVVLSETAADRLFGSENVLQRTVLIKINDDFQAFTVAGVLEDAPSNSTIQYSVLIPFENARMLYQPRSFEGWFCVIPETYIQLAEGTQADQTRQNLIDMMKVALGERWGDSNYTIGLQPITDIRLNPEIPAGYATPIDPIYLYILGGIAFLVLLIACVNFMTLSISRSSSRAKEIGIRKTIGAERTHLMYQFWGEAVLMTLFALVFGFLVSEVAMPYFNKLAGTSLAISITLNTVLIALGLTVVISVIAGIYPALILSGFKPVEVLKGKLNFKGDKSLFRTGMVVFQFTISIFLMASTLIMVRQLDFLRSVNLGFQKEHIVVVQIDDNPNQETGFTGLMDRAQQRRMLLESQLASNPNIEGAAVSLYTPADNGWMYADYRDGEDKNRIFNLNVVDQNYPELMGFNFLEGRSFSEEITSDERQGIIVNKAFADDHGWTDPLNELLPNPNFRDHQIIGVVDNFNYSSLRDEVEPVLLVVKPANIFAGIANVGIPSSSPKISIKITATNTPEAIEAIENAWNEVAPGEAFNLSFLDQTVDNRYRQEQRLSEIVTFGASFAIIIACLGLFGLASLVVVRRTKEIGVRKVLGASSQRIVVLVNKEFTVLILISILLSVPLIWFVMDDWLNNFAYRVQIGAWNIVIAGGLTLLIAWITVGYQSFRATLINPVDSLKSE